MNSKRRVNEIIFVNGGNDFFLIVKCLNVLDKFKPSMKKLAAYLRNWSRQNCCYLLIAASEVLDLTVCFRDLFYGETKRPCIGLKEFSKLKRLELRSCPETWSLFAAIPNDSLETLEIHFAVSRWELEEFLKRQKKIKTLHTEPHCCIALDLPDLDKLTSWTEDPGTGWTDQDGLKTQLEKLPKLRILDISDVGDSVMSRICQMQTLEHLDVVFDQNDGGSSIAELSNLHNLICLTLFDGESDAEFWPGSPFLGQVKLPKLKKLRLVIDDVLDPEIFASVSMENLQHIEIEGGLDEKSQIHSFPRIIENFQALETLAIKDEADVDVRVTAPSRENKSLKVLEMNSCFPLNESIFAVINACPNLEILKLFAPGGLNADLLDCVQKHSKLKRLLLPGYLGEQFYPSLVEHFRSSTSLKELLLPESQTKLFVDLFGEDINKFEVNQVEEHYHTYLKIVKKPTI